MIWDCPFCFLGWLHDQWGWDHEMAEKFRSMCPNKYFIFCVLLTGSTLSARPGLSQPYEA